MPSHSFRGSKGGRSLQTCFDKLNTKLPVGQARPRPLQPGSMLVGNHHQKDGFLP